MTTSREMMPFHQQEIEAAPLARDGTSILSRLFNELDDLPPALGRVAKYIIEHPEKVVQLAIADLGAASGSGEASVVRLCRTVGFEGFRQFKVALANDLGRSSSGLFTSDDSHIALEIRALQNGIVTMLETATREINEAAIDEAATFLSKATRIDIYGAGVSGIIGELFAYRLLRFRLNAQAFRDANMAHEVADGLGPRCVAIAISESGLTPDTHRFMQTAQRSGAKTIAVVTRTRGPLVEAADIVLQVPPALYRPTIDAIASAPAKMLILEVIATALAAKTSKPD